MTHKTDIAAGLGSRRRAPVKVSSDALVKEGSLPGLEGFPLLVEPAMEGVDLAAWAENHRAWIDAKLLEVGALLFRGFHVPDALAFRGFLGALGDPLLDYMERAAPRTQVAPNVYTSTEMAADQSIPLHHEMSYSHHWPGRLWFYCDVPSRVGGATPLAPERRVTASLPEDLKARFLKKGVMYVRNYGEGVDLPWQEVFQTRERAEVERYCQGCGMTYEWREGDRLRTRAVRQVMTPHPTTGEPLWFNHAPIFHETNMPPAVRDALRAQFQPDEMPRNAFYGDGSPLEAEVLERIRGAYADATVRFDWRKADVLMVDNHLAVHGRDPFEGERSILVAMARLTRPAAHP
ncbi:TauD/TfdA family dioxygenase [Corallococcus macrosporus]|uniref:TauD/TfdA family dioxygenase n=1 Tax=Corallococcus macrosporus TaxID=35 RepID=A0ABS3DMP1_9BACT|nr:TauD/TfdA family dioxygenase [Corallococcus macrosporus]MBN8232594.1 TauD/TfdA family dioxygenase [Corallococcus macrosporus]